MTLNQDKAQWPGYKLNHEYWLFHIILYSEEKTGLSKEELCEKKKKKCSVKISLRMYPVSNLAGLNMCLTGWQFCWPLWKVGLILVEEPCSRKHDFEVLNCQ